MADRLLNFAEAAQVLGVPKSTLRKKTAAGEVPHRKVFRHVRFSSEDLLAIQDPAGIVSRNRAMGSARSNRPRRWRKRRRAWKS